MIETDYPPALFRKTDPVIVRERDSSVQTTDEGSSNYQYQFNNDRQKINANECLEVRALFRTTLHCIRRKTSQAEILWKLFCIVLSY